MLSVVVSISHYGALGNSATPQLIEACAGSSCAPKNIWCPPWGRSVTQLFLACYRALLFSCSIADRGIFWFLKNRYLSLFVRHQVDVAGLISPRQKHMEDNPFTYDFGHRFCTVARVLRKICLLYLVNRMPSFM